MFQLVHGNASNTGSNKGVVMRSDGKFIWGDKVITPENTTGEIVAVCYDGTYQVQLANGKCFDYREEELVINW